MNKQDDDPPLLPKGEEKNKQSSNTYDKLISSITFLLLWSVLIQPTYNSIGLFALRSTAWKQQGYENTFEV